MVEMQRPEIKCVEVNADTYYARFEAQPLERGFGITLGNSLRRILLSSLPGYAINTIKIAGVTHEFTTIPGVTEDVTDLILNLKQVSKEVKDNTIEISEKVRKIIHNKSIFHRRLVDAFPNIKDKVEFKKWTLKEKIENLKRK